MAVSEQTPVDSSTGNGVTTVFPYTFKIIAAADLEVSVDGVIKVLNTDYTVSGAGDDAGGNVTFLTAPANLTTVARRRNMAFVRTTDYQYQGELPTSVLNDDQDAPILMIQQLGEGLGRAIKMPVGEEAAAALPSAADRSNKFLVFDVDGNPSVSAGTGTDAGLRADLADPGSLQGATLVAGVGRVVDSIAALKALDKTGVGRVFVTGYYALADGGGGHYYYDASDTTTADNGGSIIVGTDGGRWKLIHGGVLSLKQFGAKGNGAADDTTAIRNAFSAWAVLVIANGSAKLTAPAGAYKITAIVDVSTYFTATSYYNLQVDFDQGCVFQIASALAPAMRFGPPDGGSFTFGRFNLGSFNGNGFATTCLRVSNVNDSEIHIGSVGGYTGGVGVHFNSTGATGAVLNNDIFIAALLGGAYGVLCQDVGNTAYAFQGNKVKIGHCTSHTTFGVDLQSLSSSNTFEINSLEANAGGIYDQAGYNIFRLNFANGNSVNMGTNNGRIDVEGYQFTMVNSANGTGHVKDNAVSAAPQIPSVPASNSNYQNAFQRPATMTVSGGTMNFIAINGVNVLQLSGSFRVPYGAIVVLNYSVAPSWVWTFD